MEIINLIKPLIRKRIDRRSRFSFFVETLTWDSSSFVADSVATFWSGGGLLSSSFSSLFSNIRLVYKPIGWRFRFWFSFFFSFSLFSSHFSHQLLLKIKLVNLIQVHTCLMNELCLVVLFYLKHLKLIILPILIHTCYLNVLSLSINSISDSK